MKFLLVIIIAAIAVAIAVGAYIKERRAHEADLRRDARTIDAVYEEKCILRNQLKHKDKRIEFAKKENEELLAEIEYAKQYFAEINVQELSKPLTNYRWIRSMDVEDMAGFVEKFEEVMASACKEKYCECCGGDGTCLLPPDGKTRKELCRAATVK